MPRRTSCSRHRVAIITASACRLLGVPGGLALAVVCATLTRSPAVADEEFGNLGGYEHLALVGTTVVVALVGARMIYVANCGALLRPRQCKQPC